MKNRNADKIAQIINNEKVSKSSFLIFCSPTDIGVRRNGGRNGSRFGPKGILNVFKNLISTKLLNSKNICIIETTNQKDEVQNFELAQAQSSKVILENLELNNEKKNIHLGGGHDHAFPLLKAIDESKDTDNILIVNIDAHCDTRVDSIHHSGTPFRNFDTIAKKPTHLIQYGLHPFANSESTLSSLDKCSVENYFLKTIKDKTKDFTQLAPKLYGNCPFEITDRTAIFFSLDCDALSGETMKAVSAVNPNGIPLDHVRLLLSEVMTKFEGNKIFLGIYEYNPVYDDQSQLGSRSISNLIYQFLNE